MTRKPRSIKDPSQTHGWILLKKFFSKEDIQEIDKEVQESARNNVEADLLCSVIPISGT